MAHGSWKPSSSLLCVNINQICACVLCIYVSAVARNVEEEDFEKATNTCYISLNLVGSCCTHY